MSAVVKHRTGAVSSTLAPARLRPTKYPQEILLLRQGSDYWSLFVAVHLVSVEARVQFRPADGLLTCKVRGMSFTDPARDGCIRAFFGVGEAPRASCP